MTLIAGEERTVYEYRQNGKLTMIKVVPNVTLIAGEERTVYEYRQNGKLTMIKVVPNGPHPRLRRLGAGGHTGSPVGADRVLTGKGDRKGRPYTGLVAELFGAIASFGSVRDATRASPTANTDARASLVGLRRSLASTVSG